MSKFLAKNRENAMRKWFGGMFSSSVTSESVKKRKVHSSSEEEGSDEGEKSEDRKMPDFTRIKGEFLTLVAMFCNFCAILLIYFRS